MDNLLVVKITQSHQRASNDLTNLVLFQCIAPAKKCGDRSTMAIHHNNLEINTTATQHPKHGFLFMHTIIAHNISRIAISKSVALSNECSAILDQAEFLNGYQLIR